jgi:beta-glucosidase
LRSSRYLYFDGQPLYPFGYGLSYSKFAYSNLQLSPGKLNAGDSLTVDVEVRNTSSQDGDEVAQLYLSYPAIPGVPIRALHGLDRVHVPAGQTHHIHFSLGTRDLSLVNDGKSSHRSGQISDRCRRRAARDGGIHS